jgi:hypothetical protein
MIDCLLMNSAEQVRDAVYNMREHTDTTGGQATSTNATAGAVLPLLQRNTIFCTAHLTTQLASDRCTDGIGTTLIDKV